MNNPGIINAQKYYIDNYENFIGGDNNQIADKSIHVNLTNNNYNHVKKFGLNTNKRGKIKDGDVNKLKETFSQRNENYLNQNFGVQSAETIEKFRQNR